MQNPLPEYEWCLQNYSMSFLCQNKGLPYAFIKGWRLRDPVTLHNHPQTCVLTPEWEKGTLYYYITLSLHSYTGEISQGNKDIIRNIHCKKWNKEIKLSLFAEKMNRKPNNLQINSYNWQRNSASCKVNIDTNCPHESKNIQKINFFLNDTIYNVMCVSCSVMSDSLQSRGL